MQLNGGTITDVASSGLSALTFTPPTTTGSSGNQVNGRPTTKSSSKPTVQHNVGTNATSYLGGAFIVIQANE
jgi:hypothetical protein